MADSVAVSAAAEAPADVLSTPGPSVAEPAPPEPLVEADLLIEDVSIDGMCGVY